MRVLVFTWLLFVTIQSFSATDWFDDDWEDRVDALSEGELIWYRQAPASNTSRMSLAIRFKQNSHQHGWLQVSQCHENLASVQLAQMVFEGRPVRALRVIETENIQQAVIENNSVQLVGVGKAARICVSSEQQILHRLDEHHWALVSGPFQRRFLDAYYPMQVQMDIYWSADSWRFMHSRPLTGPVIKQAEGYLSMQAHFAGRLKTALVFQHALTGGK